MRARLHCHSHLGRNFRMGLNDEFLAWSLKEADRQRYLYQVLDPGLGWNGLPCSLPCKCLRVKDKRGLININNNPPFLINMQQWHENMWQHSSPAQCSRLNDNHTIPVQGIHHKLRRQPFIWNYHGEWHWKKWQYSSPAQCSMLNDNHMIPVQGVHHKLRGQPFIWNLPWGEVPHAGWVEWRATNRRPLVFIRPVDSFTSMISQYSRLQPSSTSHIEKVWFTRRV